MSVRSLFLLSIVVLFTAAGCQQPRGILASESEKRKHLWTAPDPTAAFVADSLKYLLPILDSVLVRDQQYRVPMEGKSKKELKILTKELAAVSAEMKENDRKDLQIVEDIISRYGWLGYKQIGVKANNTMFIVIQHADLKTQERYLPMFSQAVREKKLIPANYAMLVDRIEMKNKRPQLYGTQVITTKGVAQFYPMLNPDSVEAWRKAIGILTPIEVYAKTFNIEWNLEDYKKILPELKSKLAVKDSSFAKPEQLK